MTSFFSLLEQEQQIPLELAIFLLLNNLLRYGIPSVCKSCQWTLCQYRVLFLLQLAFPRKPHEQKMSSLMRITGVETTIVTATPKSHWIFVQLHTDESIGGIGEAQLSGSEAAVAAAIESLSRILIGRNPVEIDASSLQIPGRPGGLIAATAISAVEQALWDILGKSVELPVWRLKGNRLREAVPLYANINRGVKDRSPHGMAQQAKRAIDDGFRAVKCAPFDGLERVNLRTLEGRKAMAIGLERVEKIRDAVGADILLMVDCHWRLDLSAAREVARELEPLQLTWLEDPLPTSDPEGWAALKASTIIPLAGGERATSVAEFLPLFSRRLLDIACPDVRYIGGVGALAVVAATAAALDIPVAPHNPSGPIGSVASGHVCLTLPNLFLLEFPWGECDWRNDLVGGAERIADGHLWLADIPGFGSTFNRSLATAHPYQRSLPPRESSGVDVW
jgi:galactonate dehydratase